MKNVGQNAPSKSPQIRASVQTTPAAQRAVQQAQSRPEYGSDDIVTDVGLIINRQQRDGRLDRHLAAQAVSIDDDAIQPYVTINVSVESSYRLALIRFDIFDASGQPQFSREVEQLVRYGENSIICDHHLLLQNKQSLDRSGVWDLRVTIDGLLAAIHSFSVTPLPTEASHYLTGYGEVASSRLAIHEQDVLLSLEAPRREISQKLDGEGNIQIAAGDNSPVSIKKIIADLIGPLNTLTTAMLIPSLCIVSYAYAARSGGFPICSAIFVGPVLVFLLVVSVLNKNRLNIVLSLVAIAIQVYGIVRVFQDIALACQQTHCHF